MSEEQIDMTTKPEDDENPQPFEMDREPVISKEDRDNYFASIMKDEPYTETFDLFDGQMKITLRARYLFESQRILNRLKEHPPEVQVDYENMMATYNIAYALVSIEYSDGSNIFFDHGDPKERVDDDEDLTRRIREIERSFLTPKYIAVIEMMRLFDRKVGRLMEESTKPNFWKTEEDTSD